MNDRRADDPADFHGPDFRADEPTFKLGYKEASLSLKGISVFIGLALLLTVGAILYSGLQTQWAVERAAGSTEKAIDKIVQTVVAIQVVVAKEHTILQIAQDRTSCILTMTQERRDKFRDRYQSGAFRQECPWVSE